jgi:hypothetical protein
VGEGLGGWAGEPWRGRGGVGRRKKVGEEGGWMDKVEGFDLGRPSRIGRCKNSCEEAL